MRSSYEHSTADDYLNVDFEAIGSARYIQRGQYLREAGKLEEALNIFDQGLKNYPRNHDLLIQKGDISRLLGFKDQAISAYKFAIANKPEMEGGYLKLGYGLLESGRFDEASQQFRFGLLINPANVELLNGLAKALILIDEHSKAVGVLIRASMLDLEDSEAHLLLREPFS